MRLYRKKKKFVLWGKKERKKERQKEYNTVKEGKC